MDKAEDRNGGWGVMSLYFSLNVHHLTLSPQQHEQSFRELRLPVITAITPSSQLLSISRDDRHCTPHMCVILHVEGLGIQDEGM